MLPVTAWHTFGNRFRSFENDANQCEREADLSEQVIPELLTWLYMNHVCLVLYELSNHQRGSETRHWRVKVLKLLGRTQKWFHVVSHLEEVDGRRTMGLWKRLIFLFRSRGVPCSNKVSSWARVSNESHPSASKNSSYHLSRCDGLTCNLIELDFKVWPTPTLTTRTFYWSTTWGMPFPDIKLNDGNEVRVIICDLKNNAESILDSIYCLWNREREQGQRYSWVHRTGFRHWVLPYRHCSG